MMTNKKRVILYLALVIALVVLCSCEIDDAVIATYNTESDVRAQKEVADKLASSQATPNDIEYSLERYNLIRRAYWVNGQREKANALPCPVVKPFGYIVLFSGNAVVGSFVVDGKVSSLNSFLTPSTVDKYYGNNTGGYTTLTTEMADVDGSYGENDTGIFFWTTDGNYVEWSGDYLYSDIPFKIDDPVVRYEVAK